MGKALSIGLVALVIGCGGADPQPPARQPQAVTYVVPSTSASPPIYNPNQPSPQELALAAQAASAQQAAVQKVNDQEAQRRAQVVAMKEAQAKACDESRSKRVAEAQATIKTESELTKRTKEILSKCKLTLTNTGAFQTQNGRLSPEKKEGITCPGGKPAGIPDQNIWVVLSRNQPGAVQNGGPMVDNDDNRTCHDQDVSTGIDLTFGEHDVDGQKKVLDWKAP